MLSWLPWLINNCFHSAKSRTQPLVKSVKENIRAFPKLLNFVQRCIVVFSYRMHLLSLLCKK